MDADRAGKAALPERWLGLLKRLLGLVTMLGTALGVAMVGYLLWKTRLASRFAPIGNDLIEDPIVASAVGVVGGLLLAVIFRRRRWLATATVAGLAIAALYAFHATQMACTMKKVDHCEPLWRGDDGADR
ncbi:MAG: hypothetical protein AMXMBFR59_28320 [Rhodanobacteraceae bacterium]